MESITKWKARKMDYTNIKTEWENTKISFSKLAEKYNIHYKKIERIAKKENWSRTNPTPPKNPQKNPTQPNILTDEEKELIAYLEPLINSPMDRVLINSYLNSYRIFKAIEKDLDLANIANNETIRMQQLQIERNNLIKLGKDIRELSWRSQNR